MTYQMPIATQKVYSERNTFCAILPHEKQKSKIIFTANKSEIQISNEKLISIKLSNPVMSMLAERKDQAKRRGISVTMARNFNARLLLIQPEQQVI